MYAATYPAPIHNFSFACKNAPVPKLAVIDKPADEHICVPLVTLPTHSGANTLVDCNKQSDRPGQSQNQQDALSPLSPSLVLQFLLAPFRMIFRLIFVDFFAAYYKHLLAYREPDQWLELN